MSHFDQRIDITEFRIIAGYLSSARSPIDCLLHVKEREMLSSVAEMLDHAIATGELSQGLITERLQEMIESGSVKLSLRGEARESAFHVNPSQIKPSARCAVIYLEPYYIVHTPGLFEGQQTRSARNSAVSKSTQEQTVTKKQNHGMSH